IRTFTIQGLFTEDGSGRIDYTPAGFHAMIFTPEGSVFIDPYQKNDSKNYICYYKKDFIPVGKIGPQGNCVIDDKEVREAIQHIIATQGTIKSGENLRTYRLALAATGEYTAFHGGTVALALAAMTTTMNRVNAVYMKEVSIKMVLVANTSSLIYTNASTDPYTNSNGGTMLGQNQTTCNSVIGTANYDIGHVFSTGGGGVAYLGCVCGSSKAGGVTGSPSPVGDPFDIDYVAHEMGHQYGGNHSFNSQTGSCGGGNRNASTAYEPGSGATIMAYAGICSSDDLQPNSDDYFHLANLNEIIAYSASGNGNSCPVTTATGNHPPVVGTLTGGFTIPISTPFALTGSATDPDGDAVYYCWEEYDLGPAGSPNSPSGNAPIFRSFKPTVSPTRIFPKLANLLANTTKIGEKLPTYARSLAFRLTARDNKVTGGGIGYAALSISVSAAAGPFVVSSPNTNVTWEGNSSQTVTWSVANTNAAPVNCTTVNIVLSTDGGNTWPVTLAAATANDGTESVIVPNVTSTTARVKVEAANNIFFDISNVNFAITSQGSTLSYTYNVANDWNMVSVPFTATDMTASTIFTGANSSLYAYNNGYTTATMLAVGKGYWVRYPMATSFSISGNPAGLSTVALVEGWNMIGAYQNVVPVAGITTTPAGIINSSFYGYNAGYSVASSLNQGKGYWVRTSAAGTLNVAGTAKSGEVSIPAISKDWGKIIISDAAGNNTVLYTSAKPVDIQAYGLPPAPPAGIFDARFGSQSFVENISAAKQIALTGVTYPVTIRTEGVELNVSDVLGGKIFTATASAQNPVVINNSAVSAIEVAEKVMPAAFELSQNYPNPFNPETSIRFAVPERAHVVLSVYNQLGEKVAELANGVMESGFHNVSWNAANFTSGVYFYELKTGKFSSVKKLVLMK
ncbi:MAG: T9SS type A sorting domain-containing protein, partial [Ignavibacteriales bacterium]|nr:T9SS type A sorting domain-containing protein [Ignavibacteriales bacterium]